MKTVSVALVLCLNVGVDPPDIVKTQPCARLECWIGMFNYGIYYSNTIIVHTIQNRSYVNVIGKSIRSNRSKFTETV